MAVPFRFWLPLLLAPSFCVVLLGFPSRCSVLLAMAAFFLVPLVLPAFRLIDRRVPPSARGLAFVRVRRYSTRRHRPAPSSVSQPQPSYACRSVLCHPVCFLLIFGFNLWFLGGRPFCLSCSACAARFSAVLTFAFVCRLLDGPPVCRLADVSILCR
ncbi:unnamed protein product [Miscanthus lutarioriparius]|uniref:Uncharacterized protein n=1 Tax=Miscanthus lutarioriparius TaxID=422564 RepID=A0A811MMZ5_9POAL|nr:unnamed protein product [Miscanthus lutarioriparius]